MRTSVARNFIDELYDRRIENLLQEVRDTFREEYPLFIKIRGYYSRIQASNVTTYTRLTRLRTACKVSRQLFRKPLTQLTRDEWETLSMYLYSMYKTRDGIVSAIHPLRLVLKYTGYDKETIKELFPYPSSVKAKLEHEKPPPYVPGHVLNKVILAISDDMYRAFFALMRITGARIEEVVLLKRRNVIEEEDAIYVKFDITKNGLSREIPINWPGFEQNVNIFLSWYKHQHPFKNNPDAWLFPRRTNPDQPVPRNYAYLALKRAASKLARSDPEVRRYLEFLHPHQFRHTRAYELVFQNWNIRWIMYYFGWKKVEMVLRYTRAFELRQVYKMMTGSKQGSNGTNVKVCPRCHAIVPKDAVFCPYCGLRLSSETMDEALRKKKDKEEMLRLVLELIEEVGVDSLKKLLVTSRGMLKD